MLPPTGIPALPWERMVVGQQANGGMCHPATGSIPMPLAARGAGDGAERDPFGGWPGLEMST